MNEHWLEITQGGRMLRHALSPGTTSVGGGGANLSLDGVGQDQLHLVSDPWRVTFQGSGPPPFCEGVPLSERALDGGTCIEWAGIRIQFRSQAVLQELQEQPEAAPQALAAPVPAPAAAVLNQSEENAWLRVRAGLLVDTGQANKQLVTRWQQQVLGGTLDVGACAAELNASVPEADGRLGDRAGRLMRDFLMASQLTGVAGAARATRTAAKSFASMLIAQFVAIAIYSLIGFGCMIFIRKGGYSFDGLYDSILAFFGSK